MSWSAEHIAVLEQFRPRDLGPAAGVRLWHILTDGRQLVKAEELAAAGCLERRSQRKGFLPRFRITDAGAALLPAEAPERDPIPAILPGHTSPPRGY